MTNHNHDHVLTQTVGDLLQKERQLKQMSLEKLAEVTHIKLEHLENLEANRFGMLPAAVFVRGYIKLYGQILRFDYQPLLGVLRRDFKEGAKGQLISRQFSRPIIRSGWQITSRLVTGAGMASFVLVIVGYVLFRWYQILQPPHVDILFPAENQVVSAQVMVEGQTQSDVIVTINETPVNLQATGYFTGQVTYVTEGLALIKIEAKDARGKTTTLERPVYVKF
ncbi:MAG: helix-turn-helix domain-containing protein [Patescibacteria group bacterium]|nr:helix-turn-helix domain-containing protein [Patescibacteria group bacterium]